MKVTVSCASTPGSFPSRTPRPRDACSRYARAFCAYRHPNFSAKGASPAQHRSNLRSKPWNTAAYRCLSPRSKSAPASCFSSLEAAGGGIAASRLAPGRPIRVSLGRREFLPGEFPDTTAASQKIGSTWSMGTSARARAPAFVGEDINVVRAAAPAASLINANVALQADPRVFGQGLAWPLWCEICGRAVVGGLCARRGNAEAEALLRASRSSKKLENLKRSAAAMDAVNSSFRPSTSNPSRISRGWQPCRREPVLLQPRAAIAAVGCNVSAKNTTAMTYLPDACNHGASIFCEVVVDRVERKGRPLVRLLLGRIAGARKFAWRAERLSVFADPVVSREEALGSAEDPAPSAQCRTATSRRTARVRFLRLRQRRTTVLGFAYNNDLAVRAVEDGLKRSEDYVHRQSRASPA